MIVHVSTICGDDIISRQSGRLLRDFLIANWAQDKIELYFDGKCVASVSFFDEAIGLLVKREGKSIDDIKTKLSFPDLDPQDKLLLNHTLLNRVRESVVNTHKGNK